MFIFYEINSFGPMKIEKVFISEMIMMDAMNLALQPNVKCINIWMLGVFSGLYTSWHASSMKRILEPPIVTVISVIETSGLLHCKQEQIAVANLRVWTGLQTDCETTLRQPSKEKHSNTRHVNSDFLHISFNSWHKIYKTFRFLGLKLYASWISWFQY